MSAPLDTATVPRARTDLEWVRVGEAAFVFDPMARRLHALNDTAGEVLFRLDGITRYRDLCSALAEVYAVESGAVADDVARIIATFGDERLLEGGPLPAAPPAPIDLTARASTRPTAAVLGRLLAQHEWRWSSGPLRALELAFSVEADDLGLAEQLGAILRPLAVADDAEAADPHVSPGGDEPSVRHAYRIRSPRPGVSRWRTFLDDRLLHVSTTADQAADQLLWSLNRLAVEATASQTVLHAAGASWEGSGLLLPARSNAGKSTLITALVEAGLGYLSDEAVVLDERDRLVPFPKAIALDRGSWDLFPQLDPPIAASPLPRRWHLDPARVRPDSVSGPVPLRLIVVPEYEPGAAPRLEVLAAADAFPLVMEQVFHLGARAGALDQVARLAGERPCFRLVSGDLQGSVEAIRGLVDTGGDR